MNVLKASPSSTSHQLLLAVSAEEHAWALQPETVEEALHKDLAAGLVPFFLSVTCGTTSSCAFDPIQPLGLLSKQYGIWWATLLKSHSTMQISAHYFVSQFNPIQSWQDRGLNEQGASSSFASFSLHSSPLSMEAAGPHS